MKRLVLALLAAAILQAAASRVVDAEDAGAKSETAAEAQDAEAQYQAMLAAAKANPDAADWQALRFAYADRLSSSPYPDHKSRKAIQAALKAGDWQEALAAANKALDANYVDGDAHMAAMLAYTKLGQPDEAKREQAIAVAIVKSIMKSGDGKSPEQAFVVISVAEEYALLAALQYRPAQQRLVQTGGHAYDALDTVGPDGAKVTFYFLIDRVLAAQARLLRLK
jgi:tetratricopeptide (TPR) repeat protein